MDMVIPAAFGGAYMAEEIEKQQIMLALRDHMTYQTARVNKPQSPEPYHPTHPSDENAEHIVDLWA